MRTKETARAFVVSSSLPVFVITAFYIGIAYYRKGRPKDIQYETFPIIIPLIYGIAGIINDRLRRIDRRWTFILGMVFGVIFSIIGRFAFQMPTKLLGYTLENKWMFHALAAGFYAFVFRYSLTPLQEYLLGPYN